MANIYTSKTGDNANSGSISLPKRTAFDSGANNGSYEAASNGDTVFFDSGVYGGSEYESASGVGYWNGSKLLTLRGLSSTGTTLKASSAVQSIARVSASAPAGTINFQDLTLDSDGLSQSAFEVGDITAVDTVVNASNLSIMCGTNFGAVMYGRRGTVNLTDITLTGSPSTGAIASTQNLGNLAAPYTLNTANTVFDLTALGAYVLYGVNLARAAAPVSAVNVTLDGLSGVLNANAASASIGAYLNGIANSVIMGAGSSKPLTVNATNAGTESFAVLVTGLNATANANNSTIDGQGSTINFNAPTGHAISLGRSTADSFCTGGVVKGWTINIPYYASNTPHGVTLGKGTTGTSSGNTLNGGYAPFLMSITASGATRQSDRSFDSCGACFYSKGTVAGKHVGCSGYLRGRNIQRGLAAIHIDSQASNTFQTIAMDHIGTLIVVGTETRSDWTALIGVKVNSTCTLQNCTFIVPDTLSDSDVCVYTNCPAEGSYAGGTGYTLAQLADNTVPTANGGANTVTITGSQVIKLPISVINQIINGAGGGSSGLLSSPISSILS